MAEEYPLGRNLYEMRYRDSKIVCAILLNFSHLKHGKTSEMNDNMHRG
jgi:hypothetical protein